MIPPKLRHVLRAVIGARERNVAVSILNSSVVAEQVFGQAGRVGLIAPSTCERAAKDFYQVVPDDIGLIIASLPVAKIAASDVERALVGMDNAAKQLAETGADIIFSAGIPLVLAGGIEADKSLQERIQSVSGLTSMTDLCAALAALEAVNASRITLCTPFDEPTTERIAEVVSDAGFEVIASKGAGLMKQRDYAMLKNGAFAEMAVELAASSAGVDAVYIPCGRIGDVRLTAQIEEACKCPVITANGLFIWWALKTLKVKSQGQNFGSLLGLL